MTAYVLKMSEDVRVSGEQGGVDRAQEGGGTMLVTSAGTGVGDVDAEGEGPQRLSAFPRNELKLPAQNIVT